MLRRASFFCKWHKTKPSTATKITKTTEPTLTIKTIKATLTKIKQQKQPKQQNQHKQDNWPGLLSPKTVFHSCQNQAWKNRKIINSKLLFQLRYDLLSLMSFVLQQFYKEVFLKFEVEFDFLVFKFGFFRFGRSKKSITEPRQIKVLN